MRRAIARGRIVPQSRSTDPRMGRVSLKAAMLYDRMWINADDQGRISGDPDEIKYATCPNLPEIPNKDIPALLEELTATKPALIKVYTTSKTEAIQMLDWWEEQKLQWAYPSEYPPPEGWTDHLRFHPTPKEIVTKNWPPPSQQASELLPSKLPSALAKELPSKLQESPLTTAEDLGQEIRSLLMALPETIDRLVEHEVIKDTLAQLGQKKGLVAKSEVTTEFGRVDLLWEEPTGELMAGFEIDVYEPRKKSLAKLKALDCAYAFVILRSNPEPLRWEQDILLIGLSKERESSKEKEIEKEKEKEEGSRRGRGRLPSALPNALGSRSPPSPADLTTDEIEILHRLTECFKREWGKVEAEAPEKIIPREPSARESAQLRDLAEEISSAGGCSLDYINQAFREAGGQPKEKMRVSYVRAILLDWLGVPRAPPQ